MPGTDLAVKKPDLTTGSKLPESFGKIINLEGWARAIVYREDYKEPSPDFLSAMLAMQIITAETVEQVFAQQGIQKLQEVIPNVPGANTGPMEITDLYVAESDFEEGNSCYVIITATDLEFGNTRKFTTGATSVQATLIALLKFGTWPIRCQIKRGDSKDKGGRYLLTVQPPD